MKNTQQFIENSIKLYIGEYNYKILKTLEGIYKIIDKKVCKCPKCKKGIYSLTNSGSDFEEDNWWECPECNHNPTEHRKYLLDTFCRDDIMVQFWNLNLFAAIEEFECHYDEKGISHKIRDFTVEAYNKENPLFSWEDIIIKDVKAYMTFLQDKIYKASNIKFFKQLFEKYYKQGQLNLGLNFEEPFDVYLTCLGHRLEYQNNKKKV